ncbi:MAG TPA: SDR family NAD(P)-dependent oxidoreductase [Pyrinomonadaceae bacterium]
MALRNKPLSEQVAVVTGGGTGIGRAFSEALAGAGARVIVASRRREVLEHAATEINRACGAELVFPYVFDVRERGECEALIDFAHGRFGAVDVLINNSGLAVPESVEEISGGGWDTVLETNVKGAMWLVRAALPRMIAEDFGDVVNVSSQAGKHGYADVPSYCASKWALLGYAESLRDHVRKRGANVRVFNFCPGLVDVETTDANASPRPGFVHVSNMARTLLYALALDRHVVLEDINIYAR